MKINEEMANCLCQMVVDSLVNWPSLNAALQSGKGEINKAGIVEQAISRWLRDCMGEEDLLVLMEHNHIDYALIDKNSIGKPELSVKGIIEFKFNYANQTNEIKKRLSGYRGKRQLNGEAVACWNSSAMEQAASYAKYHGLKDSSGNLQVKNAYVLYLIATAIVPEEIKNDLKNPEKGVDSGWNYLSQNNGRTMNDAITQISKLIRSEMIVGSYPRHQIESKDGSELHCCLIEVKTDFTDPGPSDQLIACSEKIQSTGMARLSK